jgi:hypothetical protein
MNLKVVSISSEKCFADLRFRSKIFCDSFKSSIGGRYYFSYIWNVGCSCLSFDFIEGKTIKFARCYCWERSI